MNQDQKWVCPICGYDSHASGECPRDEEPLKKVCECGSGKYALDCCEAEEKEDVSEIEKEVEEDANKEFMKHVVVEEEAAPVEASEPKPKRGRPMKK